MESRQECGHTFMSSCFLINLSAPFHCHPLKQLIWSCCQSLFLMVKCNTVRGKKKVWSWLMLSFTSSSRLSPGVVPENHHGPPVVLQACRNHPGLHRPTISGLPLRLSLLQPHSGVRISWAQRNPTGRPLCHWGQSANRHCVRALAGSALWLTPLPHQWFCVSWLPLWSILITLKWLWLIYSQWPPLM